MTADSVMINFPSFYSPENFGGGGFCDWFIEHKDIQVLQFPLSIVIVCIISWAVHGHRMWDISVS